MSDRWTPTQVYERRLNHGGESVGEARGRRSDSWPSPSQWCASEDSSPAGPPKVGGARDIEVAPGTTPPVPRHPDWFAYAARLALDHAEALKADQAKVVRIDERRKGRQA